MSDIDEAYRTVSRFLLWFLVGPEVEAMLTCAENIYVQFLSRLKPYFSLYVVLKVLNYVNNLVNYVNNLIYSNLTWIDCFDQNV